MTSFGSDGDTRNANVTLSADVAPYSASVAQADQATRNLSSNIDSLSAKMSQLNRAAQTKLTGFAKADMAGMAGATALAATFESQLKTLRATASVTGQSFDSMKRNIEGVFTSLPVSRGEVVQMTQALSQLGVQGGTNLGQLATTYEKLGAATGEFSISLGQSMTQLNRLMTNAGPQGAAGFANTLLVLSKNAGVSAQSVSDFSNSIAPMGRVMDMSEKQVLGLSTSFVKAGSDGFVAANLFNSMADEISQATQTGSPAILKYANLLGITAKQFTNLPGAQKITDLVDAIAKGGPAAQQFAQAMGLGPRQMASLTALAQSGDLAKNMQTAMGTSGTKELDNASKAAFGGLTDQLVNFRNEMTQAGTSIGTTFLTPVTLAMRGVNGLANAFGGLTAAFSGVIGGAMAVAAPVAGLGALALHAAGLIGTFALARYLFRSTGVGSFRLGRALERGVPPGQMTEAQQRAYGAYQTNQMRPWQRALVERGMASERFTTRVFGAPGNVAPRMGEMLRGALIAPGRALSYLFRDNVRFFQEAMRNDFDRRGMAWGQGGGPRQVWSNLKDEARRGAGAVTDTYRTTARAGMQYLGATLKTGWTAATKGVAAFVRPSLPHPIETATAAARIRTVERGLAGLPTTGFAAGLSRAEAALAGFTRSLGTAAMRTGVATGVAGIGAIGRGIGAAGSMLMSAAMSPWGMAAMIGGSILHERVQQGQQERQAIKESDYFTQPVKLYNDQLGLATKNLSSFNSGIADVTDTTRLMGRVNEQTSMRSAAHFTAADVTTAAGAKVIDQNLKNLKEIGGSTANLRAYFQALGINDPRTMRLAGMQALAAGFRADQVNTAARAARLGVGAAHPMELARLVGTQAQEGIDTPGRIAKWLGSHGGDQAVRAMGGLPGLLTGDRLNPTRGLMHWLGFGRPPEDKTALELRGALTSEIQQRFDQNTESFNEAYAAQGKFIDTTKSLAELLKHGGEGLDQAAELAAKEYGGDVEMWKGALTKAQGSMDLANGKFVDMSQAVVSAMRTTVTGRYQISSLVDQGGAVRPSDWASSMTTLKTGITDAVTKNLMNIGPMGEFFATSPLVKQATAGATSAHTDVLFRAIQGGADALYSLAPATERTAGGLDTMTVKLLGASAALDRIMASGMDPTGRGYAVASAQRSEIQQRLAEHVMTLPRAQQLQVAGAQLDAAAAAANVHGAPQSALDDYETARQNWTQIEEGQRQHLISMIQMLHNYSTQRTRMEEDYQYAVRQSNRSFGIEMAHAARDFGIQQERTQFEFNLQMQRNNYEFHLQMSRSNAEFYLQQRRAREEFDIQMQRSTAAQVQSAFNPYERIQAQFTLDAGTVDQNIREATQMMRRQLRQVRELQRMGISQDTIDALHLADPANFQATDNFYETVKAFPKMVGRINRDVRRETQAGTALIQSPLNVDYRHALEDYERHARQAMADLARHNRQALADLNRHNAQAVSDFERHNEQLVADFQRGRADAIAAHQREMDQMAHAFNNTMDRMKQDVAFQLREFTGSYKHLMNVFRGEIDNAGTMLGTAGRQLTTELQTESNTIDRIARHVRAQAHRIAGMAIAANTAGYSGEGTQTLPRTNAGTSGFNPAGQYGHYDPWGKFYPEDIPAGFQRQRGPDGLPYIAPPDYYTGSGSRDTRRRKYGGHHAAGGVSTFAHTADISEGNKAEMIVPLQSAQGVAAVSEMYRSVSRQLVQQLQTAGRGRDHTGSGGMSVTNNNYDHSTDVSGPVTVVASSPEEMLRALQQKQKLARLTSPVHARSR